MQFAVSAFGRLDMELKLKFLEKNLEQIKKEKISSFYLPSWALHRNPAIKNGVGNGNTLNEKKWRKNLLK